MNRQARYPQRSLPWRIVDGVLLLVLSIGLVILLVAVLFDLLAPAPWERAALLVLVVSHYRLQRRVERLEARDSAKDPVA